MNILKFGKAYFSARCAISQSAGKVRIANDSPAAPTVSWAITPSAIVALSSRIRVSSPPGRIVVIMYDAPSTASLTESVSVNLSCGAFRYAVFFAILP